MSWKPIEGLALTADEFDRYCHTLSWTAWRPSFIVLHNTAVPSLAQRPHGFTHDHIEALVVYYRDVQKWSAGPHLFIDDYKIWVFTPLTVSGVHSPSWNKLALGVEMLGDYSKESFDEGRGLLVRRNAVAAMASLCAVLGLDPGTIKLHKQDPKTTHNCPGNHVRRSEIIAEVQEFIEWRHSGECLGKSGEVT